MADEIVDIYNENFEKQGTAPKSEARRKGLWCSSIHCWVVHPEEPGFVLFQKRGSDKTIYPNTLDITAAGHYKSGETVSEGVREISEELGLEVSFDDLIPLGIKIDVGSIDSYTVREFCHVFFLSRELKPSEYALGEEEVEGLVEITIPDGLDLFAGNKDRVEATGVEYNPQTDMWNDINMTISVDDFIPRVDPYYYKVFILANRMLEGDEYLAI